MPKHRMPEQKERALRQLAEELAKELEGKLMGFSLLDISCFHLVVAVYLTSYAGKQALETWLYNPKTLNFEFLTLVCLDKSR